MSTLHAIISQLSKKSKADKWGRTFEEIPCYLNILTVFGMLWQASVGVCKDPLSLEAMFWLPMVSNNAKNFNNFKT